MKTFILLLAIIYSGSLSAQKTSNLLKQQAGERVKEGASIATQKPADKSNRQNIGQIVQQKV